MELVSISKTKLRILLEIRQGGNTWGYRLKEALRLPIASMYEHLRDLQRIGLVESQTKGRRKVYRLTKNGEMLLKALRL